MSRESGNFGGLFMRVEGQGMFMSVYECLNVLSSRVVSRSRRSGKREGGEGSGGAGAGESRRARPTGPAARFAPAGRANGLLWLAQGTVCLVCFYIEVF